MLHHVTQPRRSEVLLVIAARLLGVSALNVCDEDGVVDGTSPVPQATHHAGLQAALDAAAECPAG